MTLIGLDEILSRISLRDGRPYVLWKGVRIESVFQPIYGLPQKRAVGFEALVRGRSPDGTVIMPGQLYKMARTEEEAVYLDRLVRAVHILNFQPYKDLPVWLFLNISPDVASRGRKYGTYFGSLLRQTAIPEHQVVVEIVESGIPDTERLEEAVGYYRGIGCLIAVDDFGAGLSNFDRIWTLKPEFVKLDRLMVVNSVLRKDIRRVLPEIVSLTRTSGSLVLMEGIETWEEAMVVLETDIDFVQGYYFGRPEPMVAIETPPTLLEILESHRNMGKKETEPVEISKLMRQFRDIVFTVRDHEIEDKILPVFFAYPSVVRFFVLDAAGCQVGTNQRKPGLASGQDLRFLPLSQTEKADWSRRTYFREALRKPGRVYLSSPYLSATGAHMCRTLSLADEREDGLRVFCLDIDWTDR
jgi:EAL domain-containing protein (putative c-di-GMP-specific phosphodiesterase class I)